MIKLDVDTEKLKKMYLQKLEKRLEKIEEEVFFFNSKQLEKFVNMSWNSIVTYLLSDEEFPKIRLGNRWLFPRKEVELYMDKYYKAVRDNGGNIQSFKRKK